METSPKTRLSFIDFLRGIAVLWMIEVHVIDICLDPALKTGLAFEWLDISNGFVAVAFIFCAGIGFQLAFDKKEQDYRSFKAPLWIYLRRLSHILLLAYWLHLPAFSLQRLLNASPIEFQRFADCDVLQAIVFSSLIALLISLAIPGARLRTLTTAALAIASFGSAWFVLPLNLFEQSPSIVSAALSGVPTSKFPVVPYSGYFFSGMLLIRLFMQSPNKDRAARMTLLSSAVVCVVVIFLRGSSHDFPGAQDWWHLSFGHGLFRLSVVVMALMSLYLFRSLLENTKVGDFLVLCGQESLFMYIFHLFVVYGYIGNYSLQGWAQHGWGWMANTVAYVLISALTYVLCRYWHLYKKQKPQASARALRVVLVGAILLFCLIPASLTLSH